MSLFSINGSKPSSIRTAPAPGAVAVAKHARQMKVLFDKEQCQKKRRQLTLEWQQRRRDEILDQVRLLESYDSGASDNEGEGKIDFLEAMKTRKRKHEMIEEGNEDLSEEDEAEDVNRRREGMSTHYYYQDIGQRQRVVEPGLPANSAKPKNRRKKKAKQQQPPMFDESSAPKRTSPAKLMLSEWLKEKPEDFEENWAGVICPVGKRSLVVSNSKRTKVYSRKGTFLGQFQSLLPSGNYDCYKGNRTRGVTMLDCIWSEQTQTFYVLDLLCWNSHSCVNCDMDYRQFFLQSRFFETPELAIPSRNNRIPFIVLQAFRAEDFMSKVILPSFDPPVPVDGVLFYHREGFYIPETNPLCLWITLPQVKEKLNVDLTPELLARQQPHKKRQPPQQQLQHQQQPPRTLQYGSHQQQPPRSLQYGVHQQHPPRTLQYGSHTNEAYMNHTSF